VSVRRRAAVVIFFPQPAAAVRLKRTSIDRIGWVKLLLVMTAHQGRSLVSRNSEGRIWSIISGILHNR